jgi:hypothetical protein
MFPARLPQNQINEFVAGYCSTLELFINKVTSVGERLIGDPGLGKKETKTRLRIRNSPTIGKA